MRRMRKSGSALLVKQMRLTNKTGSSHFTNQPNGDIKRDVGSRCTNQSFQTSYHAEIDLLKTSNHLKVVRHSCRGFPFPAPNFHLTYSRPHFSIPSTKTECLLPFLYECLHFFPPLSRPFTFFSTPLRKFFGLSLDCDNLPSTAKGKMLADIEIDLTVRL